MRSRNFWIIALACLAVGIAAGNPTHRQRFYNPHQKAYYLPDAVQFVNPGLAFAIQSASIAGDGTITVNFTMSDPTGLPLDRTGAQTPGTVSTSFVAAAIPNGQSQYTSYITRAASGAAIPSTNQPAADPAGGILTGGPGSYTYVFKTKAAGFDPTATQTIGIYGSRNLTAYDLGTDYASTTFSFVPNGAKVTNVRDVIKDASCNRCHDQISFHGGSRRGVALCVMCHQQQLFDPDSGNNLDFRVMIHKIHDGSSLPSVKAGIPYQIIGFQGAVSDFSDVVDPANVQRCQVCHDQTTGATQAKNYLTQPTRATCRSCHDDVNFDTGANHPAGAYTDDTKCSTCHVPVGSSDFDASVFGAHVVPTESSLLSGLKVAISSVTGGTAGSKPTLSFTVTDGKGNGVPLSKLGSISATMAGPTTDYGYTNFGGSGTATTPGYVTESMTSAACNTGGSCSYTFTHPVPAGSTGTFAVGIEARRSETIPSLKPNQTQNVQYGALNPVTYFSVDGSTVAPRRKIVAENNCNQCHFQLSLHGTLRNNVEYCVLCHNPSQTDQPTRPAATNPADKALPNQGINFNLLVHRIHFGPNATADGAKNPYVVVGFGGSHNDFSDVGYPAMTPTGSTGDTRNCEMCHTGNSEQKLPIGKNAVVDPQGWINPNLAVAGACSGCHTSASESSHFLANTTTLGESCTVCHSSSGAYPVAKVHAQY